MSIWISKHFIHNKIFKNTDIPTDIQKYWWSYKNKAHVLLFSVDSQITLYTMFFVTILIRQSQCIYFKAFLSFWRLSFLFLKVFYEWLSVLKVLCMLLVLLVCYFKNLVEHYSIWCWLIMLHGIVMYSLALF